MSDKIKFKPEIRTLADRIRPLMKGHFGDNGVVSKERGKDIFITIATEDGRDVERMIDDDNYRSNFTAAAALAGGEEGVDFFRNHQDVPVISASFEIGRSVLDISWAKHEQVDNKTRDPETGNFIIDGKKDVYGNAKIKFSQYGARNSRGELSKVREFLNDVYQPVFGAK